MGTRCSSPPVLEGYQPLLRRLEKMKFLQGCAGSELLLAFRDGCGHVLGKGHQPGCSGARPWPPSSRQGVFIAPLMGRGWVKSFLQRGEKTYGDS